MVHPSTRWCWFVWCGLSKCARYSNLICVQRSISGIVGWLDRSRLKWTCLWWARHNQMCGLPWNYDLQVVLLKLVSFWVMGHCHFFCCIQFEKCCIVLVSLWAGCLGIMGVAKHFTPIFKMANIVSWLIFKYECHWTKWRLLRHLIWCVL